MALRSSRTRFLRVGTGRRSTITVGTRLSYVLAGELTFQLADQFVTKGAGEAAFAPRGVHHTFANFSEAPAAYLVVCTPAGFERYFDADGTWAPDDLPERLAVVRSIGSRAGRLRRC